MKSKMGDVDNKTDKAGRLVKWDVAGRYDNWCENQIFLF